MTQIIDSNKMLGKLNAMYDREELLRRDIARMYGEYEQLLDDIKLLEQMLTHVMNKQVRVNVTGGYVGSYRK